MLTNAPKKVNFIRRSNVSVSLRWLEISECKELKQIVEDDDDVISPSHPQPCFPKLGALIIEQCHKLKLLFSASASSNDLPNNLKVLIINQASELQQLIGCEQGKGYEPKVELPKLKVLMLMHLSSLCQGTELQTIRHRLVHNCPLLSNLTSTATTPLDFGYRLCKLELEHVDTGKLINFVMLEIEYDKVSTVKGCEVVEQVIVDPESQTTSGSDFPSSQIEEKSVKKKSITSTDSKLIEKPSSSSLQIPPHETHSHSTQDIVKEIVQEEAPVEIPEECDTMPENISQISSSPILTENLMDQESINEPGFQDKQFFAEEAISIENREKESIQEGPTFEKDKVKTLSTGAEGLSLGGIAPNHKDSNGRKIHSQDSQPIEEAASTSSSEKTHSLVISEFGGYKKLVSFDETQIALRNMIKTPCKSVSAAEEQALTPHSIVVPETPLAPESGIYPLFAKLGLGEEHGKLLSAFQARQPDFMFADTKPNGFRRLACIELASFIQRLGERTPEEWMSVARDVLLDDLKTLHYLDIKGAWLDELYECAISATAAEDEMTSAVTAHENALAQMEVCKEEVDKLQGQLEVARQNLLDAGLQVVVTERKIACVAGRKAKFIGLLRW